MLLAQPSISNKIFLMPSIKLSINTLNKSGDKIE